jgi:hypothetical protein
MRRLVSGLGYLFFAAFVFGWFSSGDDPKVQRAATTRVEPSLTLGAEKSVLFENVAKQASLSKDAKKPVLPQEKALNLGQPNFVYVSASRLNLRDDPSVNGRKISSFAKGVKLIALRSQNGWTRVNGSKNGSPISGWVASKYLSDVALAAPAKPIRKIVRQVSVPSQISVTQARKAIIRQSIERHSGNCACDYQRDRAGRRCGKRSAWSRRGGYLPLCYENEVTQAHLNTYFKQRQ